MTPQIKRSLLLKEARQYIKLLDSVEPPGARREALAYLAIVLDQVAALDAELDHLNHKAPPSDHHA